MAQAYCTKTNGVELRLLPDRRSEVSWKVGKFMPLQGTGTRKGALVEVVDLEGKTHWAQRNQLTTGYKCLVVKVKVGRMRAGPGSEFSPVELANFDKYTPFKDLGGEDGWTRVQDDIGGMAWINLNQVWKPVGGKLRLSFENE